MPLLARIRPDWRTLLSAVLIVLAFPPWNQSYLIWIALVPFFMAISRTRTPRQAVLQGVWLSVAMSILGFHWVAYVLHNFAALPWPLAIVGLLLYSLVGQPQFYLFAVIQKRILTEVRELRVHAAWSALGLMMLGSAAYAGLDWILPKLFVDTLGHSLYQATYLRQAADIGGAALLTTLIWLVNQSLWCLIDALARRDEPSAWPALGAAAPALLASAALVGGAAGYGSYRLDDLHRRMNVKRNQVPMAVIQADIGDFDKVAAEKGIRGAADSILDTYYRLSDRALEMSPRPEAIIWPETSYPSTFRTPLNADELARDQALTSYVRDRHVPLLFGGYDTLHNRDYNAFFFLSPEPDPGVAGEGDLQVYHKNILLPFGEYIPFGQDFQFIRDAFPQVGYFGRGPGPEVLRLKTAHHGLIRVSPIICYEALFPNYILKAAREGSQLILNITNDSWFGPYGEPQLHLALSTFRSIESHLPQLRGTNTGISALILPDGTITHPTALFQPEVLDVSVPIIEAPRTLMVMWGDWFPVFALVVAVGSLFYLWVVLPKRALAPEPRAPGETAPIDGE